MLQYFFCGSFLFYLPKIKVLKAKYEIKFRTLAIRGKANASSGPWISPDIIWSFPEEPAVKYIYK